MSLLSTLNAWQWGLALSVPLGIIALYFLRLRRQPLEVPSTLLWKRSIEDLRVNALWQRLRANILLFLQILVALALLGALARPARDVVATGDRLVLLIDHSASMSARDGEPTRLDSAKKRAIDLVDQMKAGDAAMVIAFADTSRVVASYSEDKGVIRRAIQSIEPTARRTDVRAALTVASGLANPQRTLAEAGDAEIVPLDPLATAGVAATLYLISDGVFPDVTDFSLGNLRLQYLKIGQSGDNVGVMALAARESPSRPDRHEVFARVKNFHHVERTCTAELFLNDERVDLKQVSLAANGESGISFPLTGAQEGGVRLRLTTGDVFSIDDEAFTALNTPVPAKILRVGPANPILDAVFETPAMKALATVETRPVSAIGELPKLIEEAHYQLVIFDRCAPAEMPSANTLFIGAVPPTANVSLAPARGPVVFTWDSTHPVLAYLNLDDVEFFEANVLPEEESLEALVETDQGTLLAAARRGVFTDLILTAPLVDDRGRWQTDWPLKPSFPLFVMNVVRVLGGVATQRFQSIQPGEPMSFRTEGATSATIELPDKTKRELPPTRPGLFEFLETNALGLYTLSADDKSQRMAVNLLSEAESSIAPAERVQIGASSADDTSHAFASRQEWWRWLALAGLGLVLFEWFIYNRRVMI